MTRFEQLEQMPAKHGGIFLYFSEIPITASTHVELWRCPGGKLDLDGVQDFQRDVGKKMKKTFCPEVESKTPVWHTVEEIQELYVVAYDKHAAVYSQLKKSEDISGRYRNKLFFCWNFFGMQRRMKHFMGITGMNIKGSAAWAELWRLRQTTGQARKSKFLLRDIDTLRGQST